MGIFDSVNPFKKKDELGFPPIDDHPQADDPHLDMSSGLSHDDRHLDSITNPVQTPAFHAPQAPQFSSPHDLTTQSHPDDTRMTMPVGESLRQQRISESHEEDIGVARHDKPNPIQKDIELISSKLDYLRASLDAINQRLSNLEHLTRQEIENKKW